MGRHAAERPVPVPGPTALGLDRLRRAGAGPYAEHRRAGRARGPLRAGVVQQSGLRSKPRLPDPGPALPSRRRPQQRGRPGPARRDLPAAAQGSRLPGRHRRQVRSAQGQLRLRGLRLDAAAGTVRIHRRRGSGRQVGFPRTVERWRSGAVHAFAGRRRAWLGTPRGLRSPPPDARQPSRPVARHRSLALAAPPLHRRLLRPLGPDRARTSPRRQPLVPLGELPRAARAVRSTRRAARPLRRGRLPSPGCPGSPPAGGPQPDPQELRGDDRGDRRVDRAAARSGDWPRRIRADRRRLRLRSRRDARRPGPMVQGGAVGSLGPRAADPGRPRHPARPDHSGPGRADRRRGDGARPGRGRRDPVLGRTLAAPGCARRSAPPAGSVRGPGGLARRARRPPQADRLPGRPAVSVRPPRRPRRAGRPGPARRACRHGRPIGGPAAAREPVAGSRRRRVTALRHAAARP